MLVTCPKCSTKYKIPSEIKLNRGKKMQCSACQHIFEFDAEEGETVTQIQEEVLLQPPADAVLSITQHEKLITIKETPSSESPSTSLPEDFRPVQVQTNRSFKGYFLILLCCVILLFLAFTGWRYRDLLIMDTTFETPKVALHKTKKKLPPARSSKQRPNRLKKAPIALASDIPLSFDEENSQPKGQQENVKASSQKVSSLPLKQAFSVQSVRFRKKPTGDAFLIEGVLKNISSEILNTPEKVYVLGYNKEGHLVFEKEVYLPARLLQPDMEQAFFSTYGPAKEEVQWIDVVLEK